MIACKLHFRLVQILLVAVQRLDVFWPKASRRAVKSAKSSAAIKAMCLLYCKLKEHTYILLYYIYTEIFFGMALYLCFVFHLKIQLQELMELKQNGGPLAQLDSTQMLKLQLKCYCATKDWD